MGADRQEKILAQGMAIFARMKEAPPALFDRQWWTGRLLEAVMAKPHLKVRLFRFIDAFPSLTGSEEVAAHLRE